MSRHRNVRTMNYDEDYEGYDDVYGHSVEDNYCVSPSASQYMYDRSHVQQLSSFLGPEEDDIAEEPEDDGGDASGKTVERTRRRLDSLTLESAITKLVPEEGMLLKSCLDEILDIVGDSIPESVIVANIMKSNFNVEKALDRCLKGSSEPSDAKTQISTPRRDREVQFQDKPLKDALINNVLAFGNVSQNGGTQNGIPQISLFESLASEHFKKMQTGSLSTLPSILAPNPLVLETNGLFAETKTNCVSEWNNVTQNPLFAPTSLMPLRVEILTKNTPLSLAPNPLFDTKPLLPGAYNIVAASNILKSSPSETSNSVRDPSVKDHVAKPSRKQDPIGGRSKKQKQSAKSSPREFVLYRPLELRIAKEIVSETPSFLGQRLSRQSLPPYNINGKTNHHQFIWSILNSEFQQSIFNFDIPSPDAIVGNSTGSKLI